MGSILQTTMTLLLVLLAVLGAQALPAPEIDPEYLNTYGDILGEDEIQAGPFNAIVSSGRCWPGGIMHYTLASTYDSNQVALIQAGIDDLVNSVRVNGEKCIDIVPRTSESAYVSVYKGGGCSSYIGRTGRSQSMSLANGCVTRHGTIMHEFLHAYGFYHEQSRTDRDDWVTINWDNIRSGYERNFFKYEAGDIDLLGTQYDYGSVLHYSPYGFAIDRNIPTIITADPDAMDVIGQRVALSQMDIERVQILYGCIQAEDSKHFKHLAGVEQLAACAQSPP